MKKSDLKIDLEAQLAAIRSHKSGAKKLVTYIHDEPSPPAEIRKKLGYPRKR
ncbi:MAG TPA: hypothetical protein VF268_16370 [Gammaproteobacteria bacterium]|jgi:hypothetical protein